LNLGRLFGTDGVRGIANTELTPELAFKVGRAGAYVLTGETKHKPRVLIGKDTRISCNMLEAALCAGICSVGAQAVIVGVAPTPAIAYLVRTTDADAGVVISASHNSFEYNGIKFFNSEGYKLSDGIEEKIEAIVLDNAEVIGLPTHAGIGDIVHADDLVSKYIEFAKSTVDCDFAGMRIAVDCANGASTVTAKKALESLGAQVSAIHDAPDGININDHCGSTHMESLVEHVKKNGFGIGLAFDGDADRVLAIDENGELVDGDKIMAILALDLKGKNKLAKNTLVATVMSNLGLFVMGRERELDILQTKVGDRYVLEEMLSGGYSLGGEQSGHVILLDWGTTGDGLVTALQLIAVMKRTGKKLSELAAVMQTYPQILINVAVKNENKPLLATDREIAAALEAANAKLEGRGRVLLRASGTESLVRVMIEGKDQAEITKEASILAEVVKSKLG